jgi:hypothetical protein
MKPAGAQFEQPAGSCFHRRLADTMTLGSAGNSARSDISPEKPLTARHGEVEKHHIRLGIVACGLAGCLEGPRPR